MIRDEIKGKAWKFGSNVSTDSIAPGRLISLRANPKEYAKHVLEDARPEFARDVKEDDFIVADRNFGCGSSREHAPIALINMGASAVIADSFARIFFRNSINLGLPLIVCKGISKEVKDGQELTLDIEKGTVTVKETGKVYTCDRLGDQAMKILEAGGIKPMMRARMEKEKDAR